MFDRRRFLRAVLGIAALGPLSSIPKVREEREYPYSIPVFATWDDPPHDLGPWPLSPLLVWERSFFIEGTGEDTNG